MKRMRAFFSYYGGKHRAAKSYPVPVGGAITEPFAGSAGYATLHYSCKVTLAEVNPQVFGVWDYLIRVTPSELLALPLVFDSVADVKAPPEARWLLGFWVTKAVASPRLRPSKWMRSQEEFGGVFWGERVRARLAEQVTFIRHWRALCCDYAKLADDGSTYFVDPPYSNAAGRQYPFNEVDYGALGEWCRTRSGQVIVCEQSGADWLPFREHGTFTTTNGTSGKSVSREVIWTNGAGRNP